MGKAFLNFEDGPDGTVNVVLRTEGPISRHCQSHVAAMKLLEEFEKHAKRLADPKVQVDPLTEIEAGLAEYNPLIIQASHLN